MTSIPIDPERLAEIREKVTHSDPEDLFRPEDVEALFLEIDRLNAALADGGHTLGAAALAGVVIKAMEPFLADAERRGAEKVWDECKDWFALLGPLNDHVRVNMNAILEAEEANPYRAGQIAQSQP